MKIEDCDYSSLDDYSDIETTSPDPSLTMSGYPNGGASLDYELCDIDDYSQFIETRDNTSQCDSDEVQSDQDSHDEHDHDPDGQYDHYSNPDHVQVIEEHAATSDDHKVFVFF